jgi:hypothetical protein
MITNVGAQMYDHRYGYDNHEKKSSHLNLQKIKYVNSTLNVNGIDMNKYLRPNDLGIADTENEDGGANIQNGNELAGINFDRNLVNVYLNANHNQQVKVSLPELGTADLSISKLVACQHNTIVDVSVKQEIDYCAILNAITDDPYSDDLSCQCWIKQDVTLHPSILDSEKSAQSARLDS